MVSFSVFNELSLPFSSNESIAEKFLGFFRLLEELKKKGLNTIRLSDDFKDYEVTEGVFFQQFIGQQCDRDFQRRLSSFLANNIVIIDSPIIKEDEHEESYAIDSCEYFYDTDSTNGGIACSDVWNALLVSFASHEKWDEDFIHLNKKQLFGDGDQIGEDVIRVKHVSKIEHLETHSSYFNDLEKEHQLEITQSSFWIKKESYFQKIKFCPEVESQIQKISKPVFQQAISLLRDVENNCKLITDFNYSGESETVRKSSALKKLRIFTIDNSKVFFENHIKSLPDANRIYFLEKDDVIYIGYIGKHLKGKIDK